jgi:RNA-directed DNA polymerase
MYVKAKAEKAWRFWGLYVHVCKRETLREAYRMAKKNDGAPGIDGVRFEAIEASGVEAFLEQLRDELVSGTYRPMRNRRKEIPKGNNQVRILGIPSIRDRVVQGALKLILEPTFEADFQDGSFGYRPKRTAHDAVHRVALAVVRKQYRVIDVDLKAYFDTVRHDILLGKVAERVNDTEVMHLLKLILKASGKRGVPQGGVISPLLANLYLTEGDKMLERAKEQTRRGRYIQIEYARFADDLVILVDGLAKWSWLEKAAYQRLLEELAKLDLQINAEKTQRIDLREGSSFGFLGFEFRLSQTRQGKLGLQFTPKLKARTALLRKLKDIFRCHVSQPVEPVIDRINPILRGWVNYFRIGQSARCFSQVRFWVEQKVRRHLMRARLRQGFGWKRWSRAELHEQRGLYADYYVRYDHRLKAEPVR